jgi:hypothetical protein
MAERNGAKQPTHRAYTVIKREGQDDFWLNIGLAFEHADGKGFNVVLQALPIDGKIILRIPVDEEQPQEPHRNERRSSRSGGR